MTSQDIDNLDQIFNALLAPSRPSYPGAVARKKEVAHAALLKWRDRAVVAELKSLKTKKVKGANLVELKWIDERIKQLEGGGMDDNQDITHLKGGGTTYGAGI